MVLILWSNINGNTTVRCLSVPHDFDYNDAKIIYLRLKEEDELCCSFYSESCYPRFDFWLLQRGLATEPAEGKVTIGSLDPY